MRDLPNQELKSPIRAADFQAPRRFMVEIGPGHFVQADDTSRAPRLTGAGAPLRLQEAG